MINQVTLIGRLGKDPELRYTQAGKPVCSFTLATTEKWKDKESDEWKESTEWHKITVWSFAEACAEYLKKGSLVYVSGKIKNESYEKDGQKVYMTKIQAQTVKFLDGKKEVKEKQQRQQKEQTRDLPFEDDVAF